MLNKKKIKQLRGILGVVSGTINNLTISKNGSIRISKENRTITKK